MEARTPWPVGIQLVRSEHAAQAFAACRRFSPDGTTPEQAAQRGDCYQLTTPGGQLVYSAAPMGDVYWVHAAAGTGQGMTARGLAAIEYQARQFGCRTVAFLTIRKGLIRKALRLGYVFGVPVPDGYTMKKDLAHG
uniref:hypothetical protein n=1 Tax=Hylemonella sp. TaxID=2066020 RepID=UPI0035AE9A21